MSPVAGEERNFSEWAILFDRKLSQLANYSLGFDVRQEKFPFATMNMSFDLMDTYWLCCDVLLLHCICPNYPWLVLCIGDDDTLNGIEAKKSGGANTSGSNKSYAQKPCIPIKSGLFLCVSITRIVYEYIPISPSVGWAEEQAELPRLWNKLLHQQSTRLHWWITIIVLLFVPMSTTTAT